MARLIGTTIRHEVDHDPRRLPVENAELNAVERAFGRLMDEHRPPDGMEPGRGERIGGDQPPSERLGLGRRGVTRVRRVVAGSRADDADRPRPATRLSPTPDDADRHGRIRRRGSIVGDDGKWRHRIGKAGGRRPSQRTAPGHQARQESADERHTADDGAVGHGRAEGAGAGRRGGRIAVGGGPHHRCFPGQNAIFGRAKPAFAGPGQGRCLAERQSTARRFRRPHRHAQGGAPKPGGLPRGPPRRPPPWPPPPRGSGC